MENSENTFEPIVLFEDNHLLVVVKPQNMPSQADSSGDPDFLNLLKAYVKEKYNKEGEAWLGLVHRLDRPTGGVMIFARTSKAASRLAEQMKDGTFKKKYLAVSVGIPKERSAQLNDYLVKDEATNTVRVTPAKVEGAKLAQLQYKVLETADKIALLDIKLMTGRPHQIRAQLKHMMTPVFGDVKYGGDTLAKGHNLALWAYELEVKHPVKGDTMIFKVFPPLDRVPWKHFQVEKYINTVRPIN